MHGEGNNKPQDQIFMSTAAADVYKIDAARPELKEKIIQLHQFRPEQRI